MITVAPGSTWRVRKGRSSGRGVGQDLHPAAAVPSWLPDLDGHADQQLLALGPASAQPRLLAADEGLIHLDRAGQPVPARAHQH